MLNQLYSLPGITILEITQAGKQISIICQHKYNRSQCPLCGTRSSTIHSSYNRTIRDLSACDSSVIITLRVRRFRCLNEACERKIFTEQSDKIGRYARMTSRSQEYIIKLLAEVSANKGAYLSALSQLPISASTCIRRLKTAKLPDKASNVTTIGIDDWAYRKGVNYGSIIIDQSTGEVIDLIKTRNEKDVSDWLKEHPNIQLVTRDRYSVYRNAITQALPKAIQVADRFHLVKNLGDKIYETLKSSYRDICKILKESFEAEKSKSLIPSPLNCNLLQDPTVKHSEPSAERLYLFKKVKELHKQGISQRKIAKVLKIERKTVSRYVTETSLSDNRGRISINYTPYMDYIRNGYINGHTIRDVYRTIKNLGFQGGETSLRVHFGKIFSAQRKERADTEITDLSVSSPTFLSVRTITMLTTGVIHLNDLDDNKREAAALLFEKHKPLRILHLLAKGFKYMLHSRNSYHLKRWMTWAKQVGESKIIGFVKSLKTDFQAVSNAVTTKYNNGVVEGNVNRLKNIKRQMYGRGSFELLRRKMILSKMG